jgi:hypothetical protein
MKGGPAPGPPFYFLLRSPFRTFRISGPSVFGESSSRAGSSHEFGWLGGFSAIVFRSLMTLSYCFSSPPYRVAKNRGNLQAIKICQIQNPAKPMVEI